MIGGARGPSRSVAAFGVATCVALATSATAQTTASDALLGLERDRPTLEDLEAPRPEPSTDLALPPASFEPAESDFVLSSAFVLRGVSLSGHTVFEDARLAEVVAPFLDQPVRAETLAAITDALTRLYVDAGYVGSGAFVPEQEVANGLLRIQIVEGRLADLEIETSGRLADDWVEKRLRRALAAPLSLARLDEGLRVLQLDPRVARVDAVVLPTPRRGESALRLRVEEATHWTMEGRVANDLAPALGGRRITGTIEHRNVLGRADTARASVSGARGLLDVDFAYRHPVGPWLTEIELLGSYAEGRVVEGDFADSDFRNEIIGYGVGLGQALLVTPENEVRLRARLERRTSRLTFLDSGVSFPLEVNGRDGDVVRLTTLRLETNWVHRRPESVFAARLRATFGLDLANASTPNDTSSPPVLTPGPALPDGVFQSMLLQLQYARRVDTPLGPGEFVARGDLQLASGSLFSLESFAMGGSSTVRGYPENVVVTDNGFLAGIEMRLPILPPGQGPHDLRFAPFFDAGFAWDEPDRFSEDFDRFYASLGAGLVYRYARRFSVRLDYGVPLLNDESLRRDRLQGHGLHLEATLAVF